CHDIPAPATMTMATTGSDVVLDCGEFFIKLTDPRWAHQLRAEVHWTRTLRGALSVEVPECIAYGELDGWSYVILSRVPGVGIDSIWLTLSHSQRTDLAAQIGQLIHSLGQIDPAPLPGNGHADWVPFLDEARRIMPKRMRKAEVNEGLIQAVIQRLGDASVAPETAVSLIHTELLGEHVRVSERDGRWHVTGVIDWADARVGHPGYEMAAPIEFIFKGEVGCTWACVEAWAPGEARGMGPELFEWALRHRYFHLGRMRKAAGGGETLAEIERRLFSL
ncbi:MAG: phosphotransferase family protein, partial [Bradymonadia bacterium]